MLINGDTITLGDVVDLIILIGALCAAIYKIWDFFAKPTSKIKKRKKEKDRSMIITILDEVLPDKLKDHDLKIREKYKADRQQYLLDIKEEVIKTLGGTVDQNKEDLEALIISAKDVLREKIMAIYHEFKTERAYPTHKKEALDQYYKDYKKLNGNSYIDKYYARMAKWKEIYDDYSEDDDLT